MVDTIGAAPAPPAGHTGPGATLRGVRDLVVAGLAAAALALGAVLHAAGAEPVGDALWAASVAGMLLPLGWSVARTLARGDLGVDLIALLAMAAALAFGEYFAGAVIALMLAGGNALEAGAAGRARRELRALVERAPRVALRRDGDAVTEVPVDDVLVGDRVLVRTGEVIPVDGIVAAAEAIVDEAALTGESLPVTIMRGGAVRSGSANAGPAFDMRATRPAAESAYAAMVRLVREAERRKAPLLRLADRYAGVFLPVTLLVSGIAWAASGDPVRALAVLVVATPCPLILAAPVALACGVSRAARGGIIVKGGATVERLGSARTILLDKTGTLTLGTPTLERVAAVDGGDATELLRVAASLEQLSTHVLAAAIVQAALERGLALSFPERVAEEAGQGIDGLVDGRPVRVGGPAWVARRDADGVAAARAALGGPEDGHAIVMVAVDGRVAGALAMGDRVREDSAATVAALRQGGVRQVAMATGDRESVALEVGARVGVDRVYAEQTPEAKLELVRALQSARETRPVVMVGDGINDAPALALADVGIAMGAGGATVASESADAVIVVDRVDRVAEALRVGRRSLHIAKQSIIVGMGLSIAAMGVAAAGFLPPVGGAILQEGIDVAVILNALRALRP